VEEGDLWCRQALWREEQRDGEVSKVKRGKLGECDTQERVAGDR